MATIDQTMMKVQRILTGPMNLKIQLQGEFITITFNDSSTHVNIRVIDWGKSKEGEPRTLVRISAPVLREVKPQPALYEYLIKEAPQRWFGNYAVNDDQNVPGTVYVTVGHSLLGDFLDEEELSSTLWAILATADDADDQLQKKFGGKRAVDP